MDKLLGFYLFNGINYPLFIDSDNRMYFMEFDDLPHYVYDSEMLCDKGIDGNNYYSKRPDDLPF